MDATRAPAHAHGLIGWWRWRCGGQQHGASTAEEVVVLRAAVKGLEREVSNMERQLSKALTRVAGTL